MTSAPDPATVELPRSPYPSVTPRRRQVDLFLISFVSLFLELACIRWFGSTVVFLTFFTNLVLMACFLGISVGSLAARRSRNFIEATIPLALATMVLAFGLLWAYCRHSEVVIEVGSQSAPQQIYFGTEFRRKDVAAFVIPLEAIAALFFSLVSLVFLGIGQEIGRAFSAIPSRVEAYAVNLLASLLGIIAFSLLSWSRTPPPVWFAFSFVVVLYFIKRPVLRAVSAGASVLVVAGLIVTADQPPPERESPAVTTWSPYYKIRYEPGSGIVYVNNILHQKMADVTREGFLYHVPYFMNRDAGEARFEDILIIGAGSGNDMAAALAHGAKHVDAVEIDPVLYGIGREAHPNHPASDTRVDGHIDDGRSFLRSTGRSYDLIVYALVDSLVLHSGYSSIRLESFLFTEQAIRDIKKRLKPGGMFVMYNMYRQGWVIGRLAKLAEQTFGTEPVVLSLPHQEAITAGDNQGNRLTYLLVGTDQCAALGAIRGRLGERQFFWLNSNPALSVGQNGYGPNAPPVIGTATSTWLKVGPARVQTDGVGPLPTDDFPFLYLREPTIPGLNLRGMLIVGSLSLAILFTFAPVRTARPNGQMFFLGAGFMLLETKGVVHLALLFGSTWMVNSIVFAAILAMALASNMYVLVYQPRRIWPFYVLLMASLALNLVVPMTEFLSLPWAIRIAASCLVVFAPVFLAGIVFSALFRDSRRPDLDFGSNVGGIVLGGLSENLSLVLGFGNLLIVALVFYLLSALLAPRTRR
jgi:SAM-dependent methyltransferase